MEHFDDLELGKVRALFPTMASMSHSCFANVRMLHRPRYRMLFRTIRKSEACSAPAGVQGPCRASFPAWSFSPSKGCFSFTYGGCRGGPNRFSDRTSCESTCLSGRSSSNSNSFFSSSSSSPSSSSSCYGDPFEFGECGGGLRRWSFVWQTGSCQIFLYSGCGGGSNRFPTSAQCQAACIPL